MKFRARFAAFPRLAGVLTPDTNSFGVLRFAMATLVLISHSYLYAAGTAEAEPLQRWLGRSLGECAVQVFFFLSGVMVAQSFDRSRNIVDFSVARVLRIFPALTVCVLATAFILGPCVANLSPSDYLTSPGLYGYVARTLTLSSGSAPLPGVFETNAYAGYVNSSLWTLKYEVACYFGLALIGMAGLLDGDGAGYRPPGLRPSLQQSHSRCRAIPPTTGSSRTCVTSSCSFSVAYLPIFFANIS